MFLAQVCLVIHFRESPELIGRLFPLPTEGYDTGMGLGEFASQGLVNI